MTVLAHGAAGRYDEVVLVVPVLVLFVLALVSLRRRNAQTVDRDRVDRED